MKILITGSNGLLGQKIVRQLHKYNKDFLATSVGENRNPDCPAANYQSMDITDPSDIERASESYGPHAIINTAAMTLVDACEDEVEKCVWGQSLFQKHLGDKIFLELGILFDA